MEAKICLKSSNGSLPRGVNTAIPSISVEEFEYYKNQMAGSNIEILDKKDMKYEDMDALAKKRDADAAKDVENAAKSKEAANAVTEKSEKPEKTKPKKTSKKKSDK